MRAIRRSPRSTAAGFVPASIGCFLFVALIAGGCGHTNELAKYRMAGTTYETDSRFTGDRAHIIVESGSDVSEAVDLLSGSGSARATFQAMEKIQRAADPKLTAAHMSETFAGYAARVLGFSPRNDAGPDAAWTIRTVLHALEIRSRPEELFLYLDAEISILDRKTGAVIWQFARDDEVPVRETDRTGRLLAEAGGIAGITSARRMATFSEHDVREAVLFGAAGFVRDIGEDLRKDSRDASR